MCYQLCEKIGKNNGPPIDKSKISEITNTWQLLTVRSILRATIDFINTPIIKINFT